MAKGFIVLPSLICLERNPIFCSGLALHYLCFLFCVMECGPGGVCRTFGCWNTPLTAPCFSPSFLPNPFPCCTCWVSPGEMQVLVFHSTQADANICLPFWIHQYLMIAVSSSGRLLSTSFIFDPVCHPFLR